MRRAISTRCATRSHIAGPTGPRTWVAGRPCRSRFPPAGDHRSERRGRAADGDEDGTIRVTYNGEIYNHAEIRRELEATGRHRWQTDHSDTEVILQAYSNGASTASSGSAGCSPLGSGTRGAELWLVRDRIGIKPLYYSRHHGRLVFASEIKALLQDPDQRARGRRRGAVPLPVLPHDARARTRCSPASASCRPARGCSRDHGRPRSARAPLVGRAGTHTHAARRRPGRRDRRATCSTSCGPPSRCGRSATCRSACSCPAGIDSSTNAALFSEGETAPVKTFSIGYDGEYATATRTSSHYARDGWRSRRRRASRAAADAGRPDRLPAADGRSSRTSRSPTRSASRSTTSPSSRATTASSSRRWARARTSCSAATRHWQPGAPVAALRRRAGAAKALKRVSAWRLSAPSARRRGMSYETGCAACAAGQPHLLGRRGGLSAATEAAPPVAAAAARLRRAHARGTRSSRSGGASRTKRPGTRRASTG